MKFAIWTACERIGIRPPGIAASWDEIEDNHDVNILASILAYDQIRSHEEWERKTAELQIIAGSRI